MSLSVLEYIRFIAPELVSGSDDRPRVECPNWPGDVFAVACSLLQRAGAVRSVGTSYLSLSAVARKARAERLRQQAASWRRHAARDEPFPPVSDLWATGITDILKHPVGDLGCFDVHDVDGCGANCTALIDLCSLADEAFGGYGIIIFESSIKAAPDETDDEVADLDFCRIVNNLLTGVDDIDRLGATLCKELDAQRVRVLPKAQPPTNGLSTRSLSSYITLCPPVSVPVRWSQYKSTEDSGPASDHKCNLLLIPWPFSVVPSQFHDCKVDPLDTMTGWFGYSPNADSHEPLRKVKEIVEKAKANVGEPDIVVMPEASLTPMQHALVRDHLASKGISLVAGIINDTSDYNSRLGENYAAIDFPLKEDIGAPEPIVQRKHHRWKIENTQIETYGLANQLSPNKTWWEGISLEDRSLNFVVLREWLCTCVLICEDLARLDPAGQFVRAVAPDLVIALLFDGPQIATRWPAYHATVLADDPGSSVLTLSCLGMTKLSQPVKLGSSNTSSSVVGMWRDPRKGHVSINIPDGKEAAMLTITRSTSKCETADGRVNSMNDGAPNFAGLNYL